MSLGSTGDERDGRGHQKSKVKRLHLRRPFFSPVSFVSPPQRACARRVPQCLVPKNLLDPKKFAPGGARSSPWAAAQDRTDRAAQSMRACGQTVPHPHCRDTALSDNCSALTSYVFSSPGGRTGLISLSTLSTLEREDIRCVASEHGITLPNKSPLSFCKANWPCRCAVIVRVCARRFLSASEPMARWSGWTGRTGSGLAHARMIGAGGMNEGSRRARALPEAGLY